MKNGQNNNELKNPFDSRYIPFTQQYYLCVPTCFQMIMYRHNVPLLPAELIGEELGLVIPEKDKKYFWNATVGEQYISGYGTNITKFPPDDFFKKYKLPFSFQKFLSNTFKTKKELKDLIEKFLKEDLDILVCFDSGVLEKDSSLTWGHVCLIDKIEDEKIRLIDPDFDAPKWRIVDIEDLYNAVMVHGDKKDGGIWIVKFIS